MNRFAALALLLAVGCKPASAFPGFSTGKVGAAALDPGEVSDLEGWWQPGTTTYEDGSCTDPAEDNDTVMCIDAKEGSGLLGPLVVGNAPTFDSGGGPNSTDQLEFDPTGNNATDYLQYNPADIAVPVSIGMIVDFYVANAAGDVLYDGASTCGTGRLQVYAEASTADTHMFDVTGTEDFDTGNNTAFNTAGGVTLLMFTWDGSSSDYYLDSGTPTATGDAGTSGLTDFRIGGDCAATAFVGMRFDLLDLWIHSDDYTTEEAEGLCEYGNARYSAGWSC